MKEEPGNVEALRRRVAELEQSEAWFRAAFELSPVGHSISALADGRYLDVNAAFSAITGVPRAEAIGRTSLELGLVTDGAAAREQVLTRLLNGRSNEWATVQIQRRDGELRRVLVWTMRLDGGAVYSVLEDVTSWRRQGEAFQLFGGSTSQAHLRQDESRLQLAVSTEEAERAVSRLFAQRGFQRVDRVPAAGSVVLGFGGPRQPPLELTRGGDVFVIGSCFDARIASGGGGCSVELQGRPCIDQFTLQGSEREWVGKCDTARVPGLAAAWAVIQGREEADVIRSVLEELAAQGATPAGPR